ncbi:hypothetical protein M3Y97_00085500 [Aphelenchoides bicaudatus]|nr:hypothetical protein M3Y97_00085500 [Aphelenchoides bicaudatus]
MSRPPSVYMNKTSNDPVALKMSQSMYGLAQKHHEDEHSAPEFQTEPRRRSTMRLGTNTFSSDYYSPTSQDHWNSYKKRPQMGVSSGLLKKSYSAYGIAAPPSDDETPIYSASRSLKARSRNPKTLLRNLFSNHDQSGDKKANKRENPIRQPRMITQSDYFMPQHLNGSTDSPYWTPQVPSDQSSFGESWQSSPEQKPRKPVERLLSASSVGRRLFRSSERKQCSKDDIGVQHRVDEAANHQVLRRQNTDLCASRLANFTPSNFVVEPPIRSKQGMPEHRRFHTGPIVPPHAGRMSTNSMQNCIEELRRKRGAGSTTSSKASSSRTEDDESEPSNDKTERPVVSLRNLDKPSNILNRDLNSRLSVPNLSASEQMSENSRIPVAKLGRSANTGELQASLITPIVRRKYTNGNRQVVRIPPENATQVNYLPKHTRAASAEQATQQTQRQLAESLAAELNSLAARTKGRQVDQEARPSTFAAAQKSTIRTRPVNTAALNGTPAQTNSDDVPSFVHKHQPWNAVNRELKNRQLQIAKVI